MGIPQELRDEILDLCLLDTLWVVKPNSEGSPEQIVSNKPFATRSSCGALAAQFTRRFAMKSRITADDLQLYITAMLHNPPRVIQCIRTLVLDLSMPHG
jgi:hypothetical protein